jgi:hypothetical protein
MEILRKHKHHNKADGMALPPKRLVGTAREIMKSRRRIEKE